MLTLTVLYTTVFCYVRLQSKKHLNAASSSQEFEGRTWSHDVENGNPAPNFSTTQTYMMKSTTIGTDNVSAPQIPRIKSTSHHRLSRASRILLCYPLVYFILVFPLAASRLMEFANEHWSLTAVYVGGTLFDCQGWVNVILYTTTRQGIISWDRVFRKRRSNNGEALTSPSINWPLSGSNGSAIYEDHDKDISAVDPTHFEISVRSCSVDSARK